MSQVNPYHPAPSEQIPYPPDYYQPVQEFDLFRAIKSPFVSPNWTMNTLSMVVCGFLSMFVVGTLIIWGYLAEVAEARSGGRDRNWPDFTIDRFTDYMLRGLWPFLWQLIWTLPAMFAVLIPLGITFGLFGVLNQNHQDVPSMIVLAVGLLCTLFVGLICSLITMASMMHSMLSNDFMKGADLRWISSFGGKMWGTALAAGVLFLIASFGINLVGALCCLVGTIVTSALTNLMLADVMAQLHDIFVSRGGRSALSVPQTPSDIVEAQVLI
jgi:hypothetical protein